ncbi:hypothetical protein EJB10_03545 [Wolbachia endosymbiont of Brugia malayi]|uniref:hypothetical protein n=2 Tax=Wolbachia endosymbiont of Brugia malayi TaxID=80849 RepID=UPI00004C9317|nr:hypothetical protein [Wolbachia endosymbiont of Brugia malayi]AAW70854.1 Predicted protein, WF-1 [Wolbachia endosymbiont strain TRS of Brugia malayi]QCB61816.1 hypothetical protein EJB10_03545 [Wolbachia endosymbiont of Brugia malayi]
MKNIISSLLSKGGKMKRDDFYGGELGHVTYDKDFVNGLSAQCEKVKSDLKNPAYEDIVNKDTQIQEDGLVVDIDNCYFYIKYPQDVIIEVVKVINSPKVEELSLKHYIFYVEESIIRVEKKLKGEKRN